jgi:hypothetical protein
MNRALAVVVGDGREGAVAVAGGADGVGEGVVDWAVLDGDDPGDGVEGAAALGEELLAGQGWPFACRTWPGRHPALGAGVEAEGCDDDEDGDAGSGELCASAGALASNAAHAAAMNRCFIKCLRGLANR